MPWESLADGKGVAPTTDLSALIDDPRGIIAQGRGRAAVAVNAEISAAYEEAHRQIDAVERPHPADR